MGKNSFFGWFGHNEESPTDWWSSKFSMVLLCPPFSSLLPLFFDGKLSGSKYSCVCALYAEKEQQCLAAGVACRFSHEISSWRQDNYISTGIYRCSILDFDMKFCENFWQSRISADKRFLMYVHYIPLRLTPDRGFCEAVCECKNNKISQHRKLLGK